MWWDRSKPLEVFLGDRRLGVAPTTSAPARWFDAAGLDDGMRQLVGWLASDEAAGTRALRVWLSASLARPFLVAPGSGARNRREALALATAMASDATGMPGSSRVWLDRWRADQATVAVAMSEALWQELQAGVVAVNERRRPGATLTIASVRPWWNVPVDHLLDACRRDATRIGWSLADGDGLLHGMIDRGQVAEIGFDRPGSNDPDSSRLKRRLLANWGTGLPVRHLVLDPAGATSPAAAHAIGMWREASGGDA